MLPLQFRYTYPAYKPTYVQHLYSNNNINDEKHRRNRHQTNKTTEMVEKPMLLCFQSKLGHSIQTEELIDNQEKLK